MPDIAVLLCQITADAALNTAAYISQLAIQQVLERHVLLSVAPWLEVAMLPLFANALAGSTAACIDC